MTQPREMAIVACMDPRLHPERILGLEIGDAYVIRNAGGRASDDAIRSLLVCSHLLGVKTCAVIHHTDCGMMKFTNADLRARLGGGDEVGAIDFLTFSDLDASVRDDVETIRSSPFIPDGMPVSGHVYEVETGEVRAVVTTKVGS